MCRYAYGQYSCHWACFNCRKSWKTHSAWDSEAMMSGARSHEPHHQEESFGKGHRVCPECSGPLVDLGQDFKTPKKLNKKQWRKVELLYDQGITFHSCGCDGPGERPATLAGAKHGWVGQNEMWNKLTFSFKTKKSKRDRS